MLKNGRPKPRTYTDREAIARRIAQAQRAVDAGRNVDKNRERLTCLRGALVVLEAEERVPA